jgi:oligopeptide transport system substrate-binding protein
MAIQRRLRRRAFLGLALAAPTILAACGGAPAAPTTAPTAAPTAAPKAAATPAAATPATAAKPAASPAATAAGAAPAATTAPAAPAAKVTSGGRLLRLPEAAKIVNTMDPGISSGGAGLEQMQNMFEGLVYVDQTSGEIKPGQAEKWTISPDGLVYTFALRPNLKWSDGQALTAKDFEWAWKRNSDPATKSRYTQVFYPIKGAEAFNTGKAKADDMMVKAGDERTLVITLERPAPFFMHLLATWTAYPLRRDTIEQNGDKWTADAKTYISNGRYKLVEWLPEQRMTVEKNLNYWGENNGPDRIVWTLYEDPIAKGLAAYEANELDHAQIGGADIIRAKGDPTLSKEIKKWERQGSQWIVLDTTNAPLNNVKVRQALTMATDRKKLNEVVLKDAYFTAVSIVAPGVPGQKNEYGLTSDPAKAKQLLAEGGFPDGKGWPANVKFTYSSSSSETKAIAEAVQGMWKEALGIDITLEPMEAKAFDDWRRARKDQPFHFYIGGWGSDYEDPNNWYNLLFHSKADFFYTHWKNEEFDKLVDQGLAENDQAKRRAIYEQADKIMNDQAPLLTAYHWARFTVTKPTVEGLTRYRVLGRVQGYLARVKS